jgi:hypothetical protein
VPSAGARRRDVRAAGDRRRLGDAELTLTTSLSDADIPTAPGPVENWMLTGARRDRVARTMPVTVDHGQQLRVGVALRRR